MPDAREWSEASASPFRKRSPMRRFHLLGHFAISLFARVFLHVIDWVYGIHDVQVDFTKDQIEKLYARLRVVYGFRDA